MSARREALRAALSPAEWRRAGALAACVLGLHVVGFGVLIAFVIPHEFALSTGGVFGLSLGITAYTLGMRHAFDADHIGAIDNVTRKLMSEGQRPLSVGFFFALGHSSIVFALGALVAVGVRGLSGAVQDEGSTLQQATGLIGPLVSGSFLFLIGLLNLALLLSILGVSRRMRRGDFDEAELDHELATRGVMMRFYARATRAVTKPWHMYPLGCLFGLGFDTATEIGLLVIAGGAASAGLPWYAILCLPVLFAAGMVLLDTLDGAFMSVAYGWAFSRPVRKLYYNITITGLSVAVALLVGSVELLGVLGEQLELRGGVWDIVMAIDLGSVGYLVVALFVGTWAAALAFWRWGHVEERWGSTLEAGAEASGRA